MVVDVPPGHLLHAALPQDWAEAVATGVYTTSTRGRTLAEEGFIHCSHAHQAAGVANRFYADVPELLLLVIDPALLDDPVVEEPPADGVRDLFPHVYGPIPVAAVVELHHWYPEDDGEYRLSSAD
jgi:glutathione S-transferase